MEKYVCPNDRQLALRARLGTGWSSRSQVPQTQPGTRLTNFEEEQILQVLRRNEELLDHDKRRIGHLMHRLDRMRQESASHNRNECALCKQEFGRLSRLSSRCTECGRYICSNCSVEFNLRPTGPPKSNWISIMPKSLSIRRRDDTSSLPRNLPSETSLNDIGQSIQPETASTDKGSARFVQSTHRFVDRMRWRRSSLRSNSHWTVCHLCREATEVWKRSGAWFYQSLPKYHNSCPMSPGPQGEKKVFTSLKELVEPVTLLHEGTEPTTWVKVLPKRRFSQLDMSKVNERLGFRKNSLADQITVDTQTIQNKTEHNKKSFEKQSAALNHFGHHANGDTPHSSMKKYESETQSSESLFTVEPAKTLDRPKKILGTEVAQSSGIVPGEGTSLNWETGVLQRPTQRTGGTSSASALASSLGFTTQSKKLLSLTGEVSPPALPVTSQADSARRKTRASAEEAPFGILYYTLYHDTINKQLHVAIHKAKNLIAMDANGLSDPYVVCQIVPSSHNSPRPRTSTRPQCLNPVWNEALTFEPVDDKTIHSKSLRFAVLDEDLYGSDWLGEYVQPLNLLAPDRLTDFAVPLGPRKPLQKGEHDLACPTRGKIQLGLRYFEERRQLCVEVLRCSDLAPMDPNGLSDPFVKLYLRPDKNKKTKQKTRVIKATLFPEFNEKFFYDMHASEASYRTLELTVWDFDRGPSNDFIGGLTLGASAKAERRELWLAIFRPPYRRIEAWFQLSSRNEAGVASSTPGICD